MCHFFACTWFLIGSIPDAPIGWVASEDLLNAGSGTQYLASFYWAVATLVCASSQSYQAAAPSNLLHPPALPSTYRPL